MCLSIVDQHNLFDSVGIEFRAIVLQNVTKADIFLSQNLVIDIC